MRPPEWVLRPTTPADAEALGHVHVAAWLETYRGLVPDSLLSTLSVEAQTRFWERILADPDAADAPHVHAAIQGGKLIGFGSCGPQQTAKLADRGFTGEITALYVLRDHQRRGIGAALMRALAARLRQRGFEGASLWVLKGNETALRFYERHGGVVMDERADDLGEQSLSEVAYGWRDLAALAG